MAEKSVRQVRIAAKGMRAVEMEGAEMIRDLPHDWIAEAVASRRTSSSPAALRPGSFRQENASQYISMRQMTI
jgi:hypothetical protein